MGRFLKSFFYGMGSALDLGGTSLRSNHPAKTIRMGSPDDDAEAIRGDFEKVGNDMRKAMLSVDVETKASSYSRVETVG